MQTNRRLGDRITRALVTTRHRLTDRMERERGDVPGWVLITLMTAGIVTALWAVAGPALSSMFSRAVNGVSGP
ncbi:hypothetical protein PZ938_19220 [Luteipulveratus sp. YIM 133132]|uniref:Uncharacterized protein n=1 Tax=Luteipulveratus flavus TaxID=3031728 RepID=A0ABT6C6L1_9MICO|nr:MULTISPECIES: hypothetical protein [unclassified Luteipulveratus]MDE9367754.1 hypothetical protein [Luteipulveratus sp. YIM 133132]MDF8264208.1 hypothetical protein [Luteipulveratus sp. YIM 133296]